MKAASWVAILAYSMVDCSAASLAVATGVCSVETKAVARAVGWAARLAVSSAAVMAGARAGLWAVRWVAKWAAHWAGPTAELLGISSELQMVERMAPSWAAPLAVQRVEPMGFATAT